MKTFISFDYEGLGGITSWNETYGKRDKDFLATEQINAFVEGIKENQPDAQIYLCDSHAFGTNILWDKLHPDVILIKGFPRVFYMMETIDNSFTHIVYFGYHSKVGGGGLMDHTYSSSSIYKIKINDIEVDELIINSIYASYFKVPFSFIYGDDKTIEQTFDFLKLMYGKDFETIKNNIDYLISKNAISRFSGVLKPYNYLLNELKEKGKKLSQKKGIILNFKFPLKVEIDYIDSTRAYLASMLPFTKLLEPRKISFKSSNQIEFYKQLISCVFITSIAKDIK